MPIWILYLLDILVVLVVILGFIEAYRWKYSQATKGKIVLEEWLQNGARVKTLQQSIPIGENSKISITRDKTNLEYLFNKTAVGTTKYPETPILPFKFLQIDVPIVSFYEGNAEPINPYANNKPFITPTLLFSKSDEETLGILTSASQEIQHLEAELVKALATKLNKMVVYIGIGVMIVAGVVSIYFGTQILGLVQYLVDKAGG